MNPPRQKHAPPCVPPPPLCLWLAPLMSTQVTLGPTPSLICLTKPKRQPNHTRQRAPPPLHLTPNSPNQARSLYCPPPPGPPSSCAAQGTPSRICWISLKLWQISYKAACTPIHPQLATSPCIDTLTCQIAGYTFPYLFDESQAVAKSYKAACTPEFYVFDSNLGLTYHGQFDDARPNSNKLVTGVCGGGGGGGGGTTRPRQVFTHIIKVVDTKIGPI